MSLCFTFFSYSVYPGSPFSSTFSSFLILITITGTYKSMIRNASGDPSTSGIDMNRMTVLMYIGWRTIPYSPVSMTF